MKLERALEKIGNERQKIKTPNDIEPPLFSGIEALDDLLSGFKSRKCYTLLARPGNGMSAFVKTITDNINLLYQWNDSAVLNMTFHLNHLLDYDDHNKFGYNKKPLLIIVDTSELNNSKLNQLKTDLLNFKNEKAILIFVHMLKDKIAKPITLNDIPNAIRAHSDTIISIFRPEHYNIKFWQDGTTTKQQLECTLLQDKNAESKSIKLCIDDNEDRVQSCYSSSPFLQNLTTRIKAYLEE